MGRFLVGSTLVALVCAATMAADEAVPPVPKDPLVLFHASFDKTIDKADVASGEAEFVPNVYDRSPLQQGTNLQEWQQSKDYKAYRSAQNAEGRSGACLEVPLGKGHRFRSLGNSSLRRGTLSFWLNLSRKLPEAHTPILSDGGAVSMRGRYHAVQVTAGKAEGSLREAIKEPNRWHHVAVVYDCCQGSKVYVDGKPVRSDWGGPEKGWQTDAQFADLIGLASSSYSGCVTPMKIDELMVFSQPLAAPEVQRLARGQAVSENPQVEPPAKPEAFRALRLAELGWDQPGDFLSVAADGPELRLRQIGVVASRDVRMWRYGAVDGIPSTRWPSGYQGYEIPTKGLHLQLEDGARIDYLKLRGDFRGRVYQSFDYREPPQDKALLGIESQGKFARLRLKQPLAVEQVSFFGGQPAGTTAKPDADGRVFTTGETSINDLALWRVEGAAEGLAGARGRDFAISSLEPYEPPDRWIKWALLSHEEPADRVTLRLDPSARGRPVRLAALRHAHLFIPPQGEDTPLAGLRLRLATRPLDEPTRLHVQVRHPVDITRLTLDLDLRLEPSAHAAAGAMATVLIDMQDRVVPGDQPLWVTLTPERDMTLDDGFRIETLPAPKAEALKEHVRDMLNYARDRFIHVSEPRPWGHVPLEHCGWRLLPFRQLDFALNDLKRHVPDDPNLFGLWAWTHPRDNPDLSRLEAPPAHGAPAWAVYAKEAMKKYRAFALWWIENRQLPEGVFGSAYGDDSDLVNDWLSLSLICDPDGRIRDSVRRLGDYCWLQGPIQRGINRRLTDTLHAYEEGINVQPHEAQLYFGNPVYLERLMETTRTVRDELTYTTADGRRFFKSCWYGATKVDTENERGRDILSNALMLHPALYLAFYGRDPAAVKLLTEWVGTWAGMQADAFAKSSLAGPFPVSAQHPTGEIVGKTDKYISGYGYQSACLAMYAITRDDRYFAPARTWIDNGVWSMAEATDWCAMRDFTAHRDKVIESAKAVDWKPLNPAMGDDSRCTLSYLGWLMSGDRSFVEAAARNSWERISILFPMHTWAEQSADRVAVSKTLIDRLYLGGTPGFRNKLWPTHTVSWEDLSDEFAAWVLKTTPRELRLWVFNFESRPQAGKLRVWGLEGGAYEMRFGPDADRDEKADGAEAPARLDLERCSDIPLTLPSRRLMALALRQVKAGPPLFPRPDLAVVATDMAFDPAKGVLRFVVHNVGSAAAKNVKVAVEADGRPLAAHDILELKSPDDLRPQTLAFEQQVAAGARKVVVVVDPENRVSELWKGNNRAVWERPTPDAGH